MQARFLLEQHQYALVDRHAVGEDACEGLPIKPLIPRVLGKLAPFMPGLLPVGPDAPYLEYLIDNIEQAGEGKKQHLLSALLAVPKGVNPDSLQRHLTNRLVLHGPRDRYYLRYFDPRVFPHLAYRILTTKQIQCLFGPITQWSFRFQSEWVTVSAPSEAGVIPLVWKAKADQRAALDDVILLNKALLQRKQALDQDWKSIDDWRAAMDAGVAALQVARNLFHLTQKDDIVAFICHALLHGEFFYQHGIIQNLLKEAILPEQSYAGSAALLEEEDWAVIESESRRQVIFR